MGCGLIKEDACRIFCKAVLFLVLMFTVYALCRFSASDIETVSFALFIAMCISGYILYEVFQDTAGIIENNSENICITTGIDSRFQKVINYSKLNAVIFSKYIMNKQAA